MLSKTKIITLFSLALSGSLVAGGGSSAPKVDENKKGRLLYETCKACHGEKGQGNTAIEAPSINGLPEWYLISTLTKFNKGYRGAHPSDTRGLNMRPMARALKGKEEIEAVAKYVSSLKPVEPTHTLKGDPEKGKALFVTCVLCHGEQGEGKNPPDPMKAPPIANLPDWYVVNQLVKFKDGIRGTHPKDTEGALMRGQSMMLQDKQAMLDVAAYIKTLKPVAKEEGAKAKK